PPSGASCRCLLAIARIAAAWYRNRAGPHIMDRAWLGGAALLSSVVSTGISRRPRIVRFAGPLGARRGKAHQPLRAHLQLSQFQRWLSCRAPRQPRASLDQVAALCRARRGYQRLAAAFALARHAAAGGSGALGA